MTTNDEFDRAYDAGRRAAETQPSADIQAPAYERIHAARYAEALVDAFWKGVRDYRNGRYEGLQFRAGHVWRP